MFTKLIPLFSITMLLTASIPAHAVTAAPPKLSGQYAFESTKVCQASMTWGTDGSNGGAVVDLQVGDPGKIRGLIGFMTFNPTKKTMTGAGLESDGSLLLANNPSGGDVISPPSSASLSGSFSVTASTITLAGKNYNAVFGDVVAGVAYQVEFMSSNANCIETGFLNRQ